MDRLEANRLRLPSDPAAGHYESYFQRANDPARPRAFWIRYTLFRAAGDPASTVGELWAVWFDGERGSVVATKTVLPWAACTAAPGELALRFGAATLDTGGLEGEARSDGHALRWRLRYTSPEPPLLLFPPVAYRAPLPRAKQLTGSPNARFSGELAVDGERIAVADWPGAQSHNWGSRHTDAYAWGQVAGFSGEPDAFLECATARLKVGRLWTPPLTVAVLRLAGEEHRFDSVLGALVAEARYSMTSWRFEVARIGARLEVEMRASPELVAGLRYPNPPGGAKVCLNSKLAACRVSLRRAGRRRVVLETAHRAAFEVLGDEVPPGVVLRA